MASTSAKRGRPSKYSVMAENLLQKGGFKVTGKSQNRIEKITDFLRNNYKNANKVFVTSNFKEVENAKKYKLVGYSNPQIKGQSAERCWVAIK